MTAEFAEEKAKPFRLVKYFTFTSLIFIFLGALILSFMNTHFARAMQVKKNEDYALLLVENLNHQVFLQFVIPIAIKYGHIQLRNREQFERMDKVVRSTLHSFNVETVNIYDMNNIVSYSFDPDMVGKNNLGGAGYRSAVEGTPTSKLVQRGNFLELFFGFPKESKIITLAPLRAEKPLSRLSGPVLGVVEIVQDMSDDYKEIFRFQMRVILTSTVVMGLLFFFLRLVVKRGEAIIQRRTLERIRLKEQLSRAERLSALGEMVAAVSHEIRNPLGIIRSSAELLKKKVHKIDPGNTVPDVIVEEANRLNSIITDFLNFARPINLNLARCNIADIIEKNIKFLTPRLEEQGCATEKDIQTPLPEIMADPDVLYQAFLNIFLNAMQAMPGGGLIRVRLFARDDRVAVVIEDEGEGIPADILEKIWDPFFTTKDGGTGLGLGIVKNIVDSHNGEVRVENRPVSGSRVRILLPVTHGE